MRSRHLSANNTRIYPLFVFSREKQADWTITVSKCVLHQSLDEVYVDIHIRTSRGGFEEIIAVN